MKFLCHLFVRLWFRFRAFNVESLKTPGPVLLIPNHVSWLDWLFLLAVLDEDWKFVTSATTARTSYVHRKMMVNRRTFPVDTASPYAAKRMAEFLATGGRLVLFAEGRITVTGSLMKLFDGTGFLIDRTGAKVITCYLRNVPQDDIDCAVAETRWDTLRATAAAASGLKQQLRPRKLSKTDYAKAQLWTNRLMGRENHDA